MILSGKNTVSGSLPAGEKPVTNPLKGFAVWGENHRQDPWISFAYVPVYWNLLEPEEGVYDFAALEGRCSFKEWKKDNVRLILRVIADSPSDQSHMDIPKWLYEKMDGAGTWYDTGYGKGFSPDYENPVFQEAHQALLAALGARYKEDPQVAFIQLGSLGHWGEWHVNYGEGIPRFPAKAVTDRYVSHYLVAFPAEKLLLRRPFAIGAQNHLGLYNDSFGQEGSHREWLSWISDGYVSDQTGEFLSGMPDFWKYAPSGGEFATDQGLEWYFSRERFPETMELLKESHTTFLGPNAPVPEDFSSKEARDNAAVLLRSMGYCLGIRGYRMENLLFPRDLSVTLTWENTGIAPLYENWPIRLVLLSEDGSAVWEGDLDAPFTEWLPGTHSWTAVLPGTKELPAGRYQLWAGIIDPLTGKPGVALDMDTAKSGGLYRICEFATV